MKRADFVWHDGAMIPWEQATTHLATHSLHYGVAVFEGIRCYDTDDGPAVRRLRDHVLRLGRSAKIMGMDLPCALEQIERAALDLVRANRFPACYIRPLIYFGAEKAGLNNIGCVTHAAVLAWPWGAYLGEDGLKNGIRCKVSSFTRLHPNVLMTKAKCSGNYANSQLARAEASRDGYDEALLLDPNGYLVEGSGENLFIVEQGAVITPPLDSVLAGITRASLIEIARDEGIDVREERIARDRLYAADEVFLTGTAAEVTPVREVDRRPIGIGRRGPVTERLQRIYLDAVRGRIERYRRWLTFVERGAHADREAAAGASAGAASGAP